MKLDSLTKIIYLVEKRLGDESFFCLNIFYKKNTYNQKMKKMSFENKYINKN